MIAIVFGLGAALIWGVSDFLGGLVSKRVSPVAVTLISQVCALVLLVVVVLLFGQALPEGGAAVAALAAGVAAAFSVYSFYAALAGGAMAIAAPIAATGAAIPVVVGLAGGERPGILQLVGVLAAMVGVVLVSRHVGEGGRAGRRALLLAFGAAIGFGCFYVALDAAAEASFFSVLLLARIAGVSILLVAVAATRPSLRVTPRGVLAIGAIGLLDLAANAAYFFATSEGLIVIAAVLASLYVVVTVLLARAVLSEQISTGQGVGIVSAVAGVALIAGG